MGTGLCGAWTMIFFSQSEGWEMFQALKSRFNLQINQKLKEHDMIVSVDEGKTYFLIKEWKCKSFHNNLHSKPYYEVYNVLFYVFITEVCIRCICHTIYGLFVKWFAKRSALLGNCIPIMKWVYLCNHKVYFSTIRISKGSTCEIC